jgi:hypothetical protein
MVRDLGIYATHKAGLHADVLRRGTRPCSRLDPGFMVFEEARIRRKKMGCAGHPKAGGV